MPVKPGWGGETLHDSIKFLLQSDALSGRKSLFMGVPGGVLLGFYKVAMLAPRERAYIP
jgi:hypothetical protein